MVKYQGGSIFQLEVQLRHCVDRMELCLRQMAHRDREIPFRGPPIAPKERLDAALYEARLVQLQIREFYEEEWAGLEIQLTRYGGGVPGYAEAGVDDLAQLLDDDRAQDADEDGEPDGRPS